MLDSPAPLPSASGRRGTRAPYALTARGAWILGLVLILALWAASGYDVLRRLAEVERQASEVNERFVGLEELLTTVRESVLLGSILLRDALLDPDPSRVAYYREQLLDNRQRWQQALDKYQARAGSSPEYEALANLRAELDERWRVLLPIIDTAAAAASLETRAQLRQYVIPRREVIIRISERVHAINREAFARQQADIAQLYRDTQQRVWITGALVLALSLGIAVLAARYAGGLEAQLRAQMERDAQNARELKHLSSRLVRAQEDERRAIARELHDEVGQALSAVKAELGVAQRRLAPHGDLGDRVLDDARTMADHALRTVRDLSQLLRPTVLDDIGLTAALESLLRGFRRRHDIRAELVLDAMDERLAPSVETCVFRIVQEALTNVARHAEATACHVSLRKQLGILHVTVEDNGKGFTLDATRADASQGLGLVGIRERVAEFGGALRIETAPGRGTKLLIAVPALLRNGAPTLAEDLPVTVPAAQAGQGS